ncbi:hypothetical protein VTJ49DRAFT_6570 [Mycothermus thermophilus]|uniref:Uncharacterized protein n=1 Tax=Humicola insolens TaxID=85995 RepID=A0ABR3VJP9_HUMIN
MASNLLLDPAKQPTHARLRGPVEVWQSFDGFNTVSRTPAAMIDLEDRDPADISPAQIEWASVVPDVGVWVALLREVGLAPRDLPAWPFFVFGPVALIREISNLGGDALGGEHLEHPSSNPAALLGRNKLTRRWCLAGEIKCLRHVQQDPGRASEAAALRVFLSRCLKHAPWLLHKAEEMARQGAAAESWGLDGAMAAAGLMEFSTAGFDTADDIEAYARNPANAEVVSMAALIVHLHKIRQCTSPGTVAFFDEVQRMALNRAWPAAPELKYGALLERLHGYCAAVPTAHPALNIPVVLTALNFYYFERMKLVPGNSQDLSKWTGDIAELVRRRNEVLRMLIETGRETLVMELVRCKFNIDRWYPDTFPKPVCTALILDSAPMARPMDMIMALGKAPMIVPPSSSSNDGLFVAQHTGPTSPSSPLPLSQQQQDSEPPDTSEAKATGKNAKRNKAKKAAKKKKKLREAEQQAAAAVSTIDSSGIDAIIDAYAATKQDTPADPTEHEDDAAFPVPPTPANSEVPTELVILMKPAEGESASDVLRLSVLAAQAIARIPGGSTVQDSAPAVTENPAETESAEKPKHPIPGRDDTEAKTDISTLPAPIESLSPAEHEAGQPSTAAEANPSRRTNKTWSPLQDPAVIEVARARESEPRIKPAEPELEPEPEIETAEQQAQKAAKEAEKACRKAKEQRRKERRRLEKEAEAQRQRDQEEARARAREEKRRKEEARKQQERELQEQKQREAEERRRRQQEEEEKKRLEQERKREQAAREARERELAAARAAAEQAQREEDQRKADQARQEEARRAGAARLAKEAEARRAEKARRAEELRRAEEAKRIEQARQEEEARQAEKGRLAKEKARQQEARRAEEARQEAARREEQVRLAKEEEARRAEDARIAREKETKHLEQARHQDEALRAEQARITQEKDPQRIEQEHRDGKVTLESLQREKHRLSACRDHICREEKAILEKQNETLDEEGERDLVRRTEALRLAKEEQARDWEALKMATKREKERRKEVEGAKKVRIAEEKEPHGEEVGPVEEKGDSEEARREEDARRLEEQRRAEEVRRVGEARAEVRRVQDALRAEKARRDEEVGSFRRVEAAYQRLAQVTADARRVLRTMEAASEEMDRELERHQKLREGAREARAELHARVAGAERAVAVTRSAPNPAQQPVATSQASGEDKYARARAATMALHAVQSGAASGPESQLIHPAQPQDDLRVQPAQLIHQPAQHRDVPRQQDRHQSHRPQDGPLQPDPPAPRRRRWRRSTRHRIPRTGYAPYNHVDQAAYQQAAQVIQNQQVAIEAAQMQAYQAHPTWMDVSQMEAAQYWHFQQQFAAPYLAQDPFAWQGYHQADPYWAGGWQHPNDHHGYGHGGLGLVEQGAHAQFHEGGQDDAVTAEAEEDQSAGEQEVTEAGVPPELLDTPPRGHAARSRALSVDRPWFTK